MNHGWHQILRLAAIFGTGLGLIEHRLRGQTAADAGAAPVPAPPAAESGVLPECPIESFRRLLAMNSQDQEQFLASKTPEDRAEILAKISEYQALRPDDCHLRLAATELQWYLRQLVSAPETNRTKLLAAVPEKDRKLVEDRLRYWDRLPASAKQELQANQAAVMYFSTQSPQKVLVLVSNVDTAQKEIQRLSAMPEEKRQQILDRFKLFFAFTPAEKVRILRTLSEPERQQIEETLRKLETMSEQQRNACIQSFEKFTNLRPEERQQFLKSAERWKLMTPDERQQFKDLVDGLSSIPPLPQDYTPPPQVRAAADKLIHR